MTEWIEIEIEGGPKNLVTKRVPKAWYEYNQRVDEVASSLKDELRDVEEVTAVGKTNGERKIEGKKVSQPIVYVEDEYVNEIPSEIDGIPIETDSPKGPLNFD